MKPLFTMREALGDPNLLGDVLIGDEPGRVARDAHRRDGRVLTDSERAIFQRFTGRARSLCNASTKPRSLSVGAAARIEPPRPWRPTWLAAASTPGSCAVSAAW